LHFEGSILRFRQLIHTETIVIHMVVATIERRRVMGVSPRAAHASGLLGTIAFVRDVRIECNALSTVTTRSGAVTSEKIVVAVTVLVNGLRIIQWCFVCIEFEARGAVMTISLCRCLVRVVNDTAIVDLVDGYRI
jgi:hypothetical protein